MDETSGAGGNYQTGSYWRKRSDMMYYRYLDYIIRCVGPKATSMIDVGSWNCPYLEWWGWIADRVSVDIRVPYESASVKGIKGDIHELNFDRKFDLCTCFQVLEHVPDATRFARRLLELGNLVVASVPYEWSIEPERSAGHIHDPVSYEMLTGWFGRPANYKIVVEEPFGQRKHKRLIALYDQDPVRRFSSGLAAHRVLR